ncbi:MAG: FMN-binding protein [Caldilineaceae bacterium]|nr:FMN-binding protein [Caldilineaceae bacterium]
MNDKKTGQRNLRATLQGLGAIAAISGTLYGCTLPSANQNANLSSAAADAAAAADDSLLRATLTPELAALVTATPATAVIPAPTFTPAAVPPAATSEPAIASSAYYQDGVYVGSSERADRWGNMQVRAIIENGDLTAIEILDYPRSTGRSDIISRGAIPSLISEAITNQDADINIVSRATDTSVAFIRSLETALETAHIGGA